MKFNRFEYESVVDGLKDWYLFHDAGAGTDCVVILHGHGSHGDQLLICPDLAPWLASLDRFGVSVVSPNLRDNAWMSPAAVSDLSRLLEEGKTRHRWRRIVFASGMVLSRRGGQDDFRFRSAGSGGNSCGERGFSLL